MFSCFAVHSLRAVAMLFNIFRKLKKSEVLRPIFLDYVIFCDYDLIWKDKNVCIGKCYTNIGRVPSTKSYTENTIKTPSVHGVQRLVC